MTPSAIAWSRHPARDRPWATAFALFVIVLFAVLAAQLMEHVGWGAVSGFVLLVSLRHFFFATEYEVDSQGISVKHLGRTTRQSWVTIRRFEASPRSLILSTRVRPSFLDTFRSIHLLLPPEEAVLVQMREWWTSAHETGGI
ncbi:MAG: hypothetical protein R3C01_10620 [Planctomycetaceae bacterium]